MPKAIAAVKLGLLALCGGTNAEAGCDVIPPAAESFRGVLGTTDRPFARPGDWVRLSLDPTCHATSTGFGGSPADLVGA